MKKVAIVQSNYIPWKGYFDLIASVDEFILYDDMQYTRRDWRNRNKIKTPQGLKWLTAPVKVKGKYHQKICETEVDGHGWLEDHWKTIQLNYRKAPFFREVADIFEPYYFNCRKPLLSEINRDLLEMVCSYLGIDTRITCSMDYELIDGKSERLLDLTHKAGGSEYVSGPAAQGYLDEAVFAESGVKVRWFDYSGYPEYLQLWGDFEHGVTVLDLLFNCGKESRRYLRFVE